MKNCMLVLAFSLLYLSSSGQIWRDKVSRKNEEGNTLYRQKNYTDAISKYVEAQDGKTHQQELSYNLANTLYQQKKFPEAIKELEKSISSTNLALNQKIYFNRGNSFFQLGQYQPAVESYKKALELDSRDREAKHNLELALKKLQENPQQQKQNSKSQDQNQKKDPSREDQKNQDQKPDQQKQQESSKSKGQSEEQKQNSDSKQNQPQQAQARPQQKNSMDPKEAIRILDALNQQEKREQRKQALKVQRARSSGKDW